MAMNNEDKWANVLGYNLGKQLILDDKYYNQIVFNVKKHEDNYDKYEMAVKNFLCIIIPTQQKFAVWKLKISDYQKLKLIECINFLDASHQLNNRHLIVTSKQPKYFTFFTDRKIIQINK